jgi:hypothetical protein
MFRRFCFRSRSLLAMLLAFCLVSASLWGYGAEAMADALSDEISFSVAAGDAGDHAATEKLCNHGCHAQTHLTGLDSSIPTINFPATETVFSSEGSIDVASQPCGSLYRPPRSTFQA